MLLCTQSKLIVFIYSLPCKHSKIRNAAGSAFNKYGITHAGLGVWDTTKDAKFSIELICDDYLGMLLPNLLPDRQLNWSNAASIVITKPMKQEFWTSSRLITTGTGNAYSQLITYLQDNKYDFSNYQPVTILSFNASDVYNTSKSYSTDDFDSVGDIVLKAHDSFKFVDTMINQLNSYGLDLDSFLRIYSTSFDYISYEKTEPPVVSWDSKGKANAAVYKWYSRLTDCYNALYQKVLNSDGGAQLFITVTQKCSCY